MSTLGDLIAAAVSGHSPRKMLTAADVPTGKLPADLTPVHLRGDEPETPGVRDAALAIRAALLALPGDEDRRTALSLAGFCRDCGGDDAAAIMNGGMFCQCSNDE